MNWKTPVTLIVLIVLLVVGTMVGWRYATRTCRAWPTRPTPMSRGRGAGLQLGQALEARAVTVNVFNTSGEPNLAGRTIALFLSRGFSGGVAENSEERVPGRRVLLTAADPNSAQVRLVRKHLKGVVRSRVSDEANTGTAVNVYLGDRFRGLRGQAPSSVKVEDAPGSASKWATSRSRPAATWPADRAD
jgi:hypothetical protein